MKSNIVLKAPATIPAGSGKRIKVFLGGSIEMGKAEDWQKRVTADIEGHNLIVFNPRRDDWDSSWVQSADNPQFYEQVTWELSNIDQSDIVVFYFASNTISPITLLELGTQLGSRYSNIIVFCDPTYSRRGNVDITCEMYGVKVHSFYNDFIKALRERITAYAPR